ncbi:Fic family protein [soil metagenome]
MKIPQQPPDMGEVLDRMDFEAFERILTSDVKASQRGQYRHWDEIRYREPPEGMSHEEWWYAIRYARRRESHELPLTDEYGHPFTYMMPDKAWERVHKIDQRLGGRITLGEEVTKPSTRNRYLVNSLIEESITSSQLEGANTSGQVAKEMIKTGRLPRDKSERMILSNYHAMNFIREYTHEKMTPEFVCELHRLVTERTLDDSKMAGQVQLPGEERVKVFDGQSGAVLHIPPPAEQLSERLEKLCEFANGQSIGAFLHPVIRAIIVHFWLAYDHPFLDGNGRTARALFYWSMLSQGYWLAEFLTISRILVRAPVKYARSFLYTETDERDMTYFIMYQLQVIMRAINDLEGYLQRKMAEVKQTERLFKRSVEFNHRQIALLSHALRHPDQAYTVKSHASSHNVVSATARTDLLDLTERRLLIKQKIGKAFYFFPAEGLAANLESI